ncbi:MAG: hypothetical protein JWN23_99 [Rhodocyclales bacterium]|nr:hypothetical protein [Rhodocyclales bacterium]
MTRKILQFLFWPTCAAAAIILASCAAPSQLPPAYVAPSSGAVAKLQVRSQKLAGPAIFYSFDDPRACSGGRIITDTWASKGVLKGSTALRAGEPITLWLSYLAPGERSCNIVRTFRPNADKNYLAYALATDSGCSLSIQDITDPANPKSEQTYVPRTYLPTAASQLPHCVAADVDTLLAKPHRSNLSGMKIEELLPLLPPDSAPAK